MRSNNLNEAERVLTICNACRYCEGFCSVFPAMELRRAFTAGDLNYLANLCHNCRGCYYACQYAPPHEFQVNVPQTLARLRLETYRECCRPRLFRSLLNGSAVPVGLVTALATALVLFAARFGGGPGALFETHLGAGAFYRLIPYWAMVLPFTAAAALAILVLGRGLTVFWSATGGNPAEFRDLRAHLRAAWDVLRLRYLEGGGDGCNYPDERFSMSRRYFHHAVFHGFLLCLASTSLAFVYDHLLGRAAPYPVLSWPVALGTLGGLALLIGTGGMIYLKTKMDRAPAAEESFGMDLAFVLLLFAVSLTGLLLLLLRSTPTMGTLLVLHLGCVAGFFLTLPYGKFLHSVYRYAALARNAGEQFRQRAGTAENDPSA